MATLPTVPSFITGETPNLAKLNQLAYCVTFISTIQAFGQFTNTGQSIANNTNTAITLTKVTDRDGGWAAGNPTRYTAQTPGYYHADAVVAFASAAGGARALWFQMTTGANHPGGAGQTFDFGYATQSAPAGACRMSTGELAPYMYIADYLEVWCWQNSGGALNTSAGALDISLTSLGP